MRPGERLAIEVVMTGMGEWMREIRVMSGHTCFLSVVVHEASLGEVKPLVRDAVVRAFSDVHDRGGLS